jgi:hypothetical protein
MLSIPLLVLLGIEGAFALVFAREYPNSTLAVQGLYRFIAAPYRNYANNPGYVNHRDGIAYRYNNCGFRDEEDLGAKAPDEFRVFFMGGSAAYGDPAWERGQYRAITGQKTYPSSETISAYLQQELQRAMPDRRVRVVNAAVPNYSIQHVYLTYLGLVRLLSPDLIISMDGWNEDYWSDNAYVRAISPTEKSGSPWIIALRTHSYALYYLGFVAANLRPRPPVDYIEEARLDHFDFEQDRREVSDFVRASTPDPGVFDDLMKVYESFWTATRLDQVPTLFTTQPLPMLDTTKPFTPEEKKLFHYLYLLRKQQESVGVAHLGDRLAQRAGGDFHFTSLQSVFADFPEPAYTDYCHLTPGANRHLAERLAAYIRSVPEWTRRAPVVRHFTKPVAKDRLGVDATCGGLQ